MAKKSASTAATYTRSYLFKVDTRCNAGKLKKLDVMQAEWQRLLPLVGSHLWAQFGNGGYNAKSLSSTVGKQAHADAQASSTLVKRFHTGRVCEYVKYTTLGMQGLDIWGSNMLARMEKATPGTMRFEGVIGHVRAGMRELDGKGASLPSIQILQRLLSGIKSGTISTRYSE